MTYDVAIVGGGVIGTACADALAAEGLSVCLLDRGPIARESSWAGAGLLFPLRPWQYPPELQRLLRASLSDFATLAPRLLERTGISIGWRRTGLVVTGSEIERLAEWCRDLPHLRGSAREFDPCIREELPALLLPAAEQITTPLAVRAFAASARSRGARILEWRAARAIGPSCVRTDEGDIRARFVVLAAGAWSSALLPEVAVEPVRGQILLYRAKARRMIVFPEGDYVVPRSRGLALFGSTLERVGDRPLPTREAYARLAERAEKLAGLRPDRMLAAWAGLRPATGDLLPIVNRDPDRPWLVRACGHFRYGILLAPRTARTVVDLILERTPEEPRFPPAASSSSPGRTP